MIQFQGERDREHLLCYIVMLVMCEGHEWCKDANHSLYVFSPFLHSPLLRDSFHILSVRLNQLLPIHGPRWFYECENFGLVVLHFDRSGSPSYGRRRKTIVS